MDQQIGHISDALVQRDKGKLPVQPVSNPRRQMHELVTNQKQMEAVTVLCNGKEIYNQDDFMQDDPVEMALADYKIENSEKAKEFMPPLLEENYYTQMGLPEKKKDPGSFSIECSINGIYFDRALIDSGSSVNLMPLPTFERLNIGTATPTDMILHFADQSSKKPYGKIEDVIVEVDEFRFPVDFIILDIKEDEHVSLILGRPFLATGRANMNMETGELELKVGNDKIVFSVYETGESSSEDYCNDDSTNNEFLPMVPFENHHTRQEYTVPISDDPWEQSEIFNNGMQTIDMRIGPVNFYFYDYNQNSDCTDDFLKLQERAYYEVLSDFVALTEWNMVDKERLSNKDSFNDTKSEFTTPG